MRRKYDATFALWMMFVLGKHAMFGHDPPMYLRSMTATCCPCPANVQAAMVDPVPPSRITRSNASGGVCFSTWADGVFSKLFMRRVLSERQVHSSNLVTNSWFLATFGDSGSLRHDGPSRV